MSTHGWDKTEGLVIPVTNEGIFQYHERIKRMLTEKRNMYFEQHRAKHFCHYGPFPCYICPIWDFADFSNDSNYEIAIQLQKLRKTLVWTKKTPESIGQWKIVPFSKIYTS